MASSHIHTLINQISEGLFAQHSNEGREMHQYLLIILAAVNVIVLSATFFSPVSA